MAVTLKVKTAQRTTLSLKINLTQSLNLTLFAVRTLDLSLTLTCGIAALQNNVQTAYENIFAHKI